MRVFIKIEHTYYLGKWEAKLMAYNKESGSWEIKDIAEAQEREDLNNEMQERGWIELLKKADDEI